MQRRTFIEDKQAELELQTFNLFPDRWEELYREKMLGGIEVGDKKSTDHGSAFGEGVPEYNVTADDIDALNTWVDTSGDTKRMNGGQVQDNWAAVLGYAEGPGIRV